MNGWWRSLNMNIWKSLCELWSQELYELIIALYTQLLQSFLGFLFTTAKVAYILRWSSFILFFNDYCFNFLLKVSKVTIFRAFPLTWSVAKQSYWNQKDSTPTGLVWDTNMTAVQLFWDTNMAAVTPCENTV